MCGYVLLNAWFVQKAENTPLLVCPGWVVITPTLKLSIAIRPSIMSEDMHRYLQLAGEEYIQRLYGDSF